MGPVGIGATRSQCHRICFCSPLPAYAPELNPVEHVWDDLREKQFHNRVFPHFDALEDHLATALRDYELSPQRVRSIVAWPWIINALMN